MRRAMIWLAALMLLCTLVVSSVAAEEGVTLKLSETELFLQPGKTAAVKASVAPSSARKQGVTWSTSDPSVATVDSRGRVTGVKVGGCELTAVSVADASVSVTIPVQVVVYVKKLSADIGDVFVGEKAQISVTCEPANATMKSFAYASSKESVATVDADGVVTGVSTGRATLTITSADGKARTRVTVSVQNRPQTVTLNQESLSVVAGKSTTVKATVEPRDAANKRVTWTSADETIAKVDSKGRVTGITAGQTTITATAQANPQASASLTVQVIELAKSVRFTSSSYDVIIGQTVQLATQVLPASASITDVTYSVKNKKIASVDENGLVTALKGGTTTVYAVTADGSRKRASAKLNVIVPVTGVSYKREGLRVGAGAYGTFTVTLAPEDATNRKMTWVSSDESIATVTGTTNRFKVKGRRWGRCTVTGTTEDGGFTVTVSVNVGSLRNAVSVTSVAIKNGKPYLVLKNKSNMDISEVRFVMRGYDLSLRPISMSTRGSDRARLYGTYDHTLTPGASTHHGNFTFENHSDYANMAVLEFAITGWSTSTGYYDDNGTLRYDYDMSEKNWAWVSTPTPDVDLAK